MSNSTVGFSPSTASNLEDAKKVGSLDPRLSRTDYFDGRLLTATDLIRDQTYVDERVLEVGRALGSGVVRGLVVELSEDKRFLTVNPGLAISESGRVLEVTTDKPLEIDLYDRALLINLNQGRYRRFNRGLYAVTLQYVEMGSDSAESYPADPAEKNEFQYDSYVEGAEITLTPLNFPLPSDNKLVSRASLAQHFLQNPGQANEISDQAIALGVLAFNNDRPQWIDIHLLRRPMRPEHVTAAWQMDLQRHFLELLDKVMIERNSQSQYAEFAASQYFNLLPPAGVLPIACVDPVKAIQYFFPEHYDISISPVRYEDLAVIQSESMQLAALDLNNAEAAEIMILAPMSNQAFIEHARSLGYKTEANNEHEKDVNYWLHATDLLQQRLSANSVIPTDNARTVWMNIWRTLGDGLLHYVRRPARAAETQVSAVVLAHGFEIPNATNDTDTPDQPDDQSERIAELESEIVTLNNDNATLTEQNRISELALQSIKTERDKVEEKLKECESSQNDNGSGSTGGLGLRNIEEILDMRGTTNIRTRTAAVTAFEQLQQKETDLQSAKIIVKNVNGGFDKVLWTTMASASKNGTLAELEELTVRHADNPKKLAQEISGNAREFGIDSDTASQWEKLGTKLA